MEVTEQQYLELVEKTAKFIFDHYSADREYSTWENYRWKTGRQWEAQNLLEAQGVRVERKKLTTCP